VGYEIIVIVWLLFMFCGCAGLYSFATYQPVKAKTRGIPEEAIVEAPKAKVYTIDDEEESIRTWKEAVKHSASPNRPLYYAHITVQKFNPHHKPSYQYYNGKGFGFLTYHGGLLCNNGTDWIKKHYEKYPDGILPEQTITKRRVKA